MSALSRRALPGCQPGLVQWLANLCLQLGDQVWLVIGSADRLSEALERELPPARAVQLLPGLVDRRLGIQDQAVEVENQPLDHARLGLKIARISKINPRRMISTGQ